MGESKFQKRLLDLRRSKIQAAGSKSKEKEIAPVLRRELTLFRTSPSQERIVKLLNVKPEMSEAYNIPVAFLLTGDLQIDNLRCAVEKVVKVNEALRIVFVMQDNQVKQAIGEHYPELEVVDFNMTYKKAEQTLGQQIYECSIKPFSLKEGPLIQFKLFCMKDKYVFSIIASHLIVDGWSIDILLHELCYNYNQLCLDKPLELPDKTIQYVDYVEWQYNWKGKDSYNNQFDYWMEKLKDWKKPFLFHQQEEYFNKDLGSCLTFTIHQKETETIRDFVRRHKGSVYIALLTAYNSLLYQFTKEPYVVIGSPNANRGNAQVNDVMGFFVNDFVLCNYLGDNPTYGELYQRVYETSLEAISNGDIPLEDYYNCLLPNVDKHRMIQVKFNYRREKESARFYNIDMQDYKIPGRLATSNFNFIAIEKEDVIECSIEFNKRYFKEKFIEKFRDEMITVLVHMESSYNTRIDK